MIPGMNMNQIKKLMKDVENIPAERVIIEGPKRYVIENPQVVRMNVMGQDSLQVIGNLKEAPEEKELFTDEDVKLVVQQTGADEEDVREKLIENDGDIAKTILDLKD